MHAAEIRRRRMLADMGISCWELRGQAADGAGTDTMTDAPATEVMSSERVDAVAPTVGAHEVPATAGDRHHRIATLDWEALREDVSACTACGLCKQRTRTVFGVGNTRARWLLVGEAPGAEEDLRGEPFVGQAGRLLDAILKANGLSRQDDVFIANVLKCRPPGNRDPQPDEVAACEAYLQRQIALVSPTLIVIMGRSAAQTLLGTDASIARLRGTIHRYRLSGHEIPAVVTYHPAYLLRTPADKAKAWADWCLARARITQA